MWCASSHLCEVCLLFSLPLSVFSKNTARCNYRIGFKSTGIECSTASVVFNERGVEDGTEELPYSTLNDPYTQSKAKAEQVVLAANGRRLNSTQQELNSPTTRRRRRSQSGSTATDDNNNNNSDDLFIQNILFLFFVRISEEESYLKFFMNFA